MEQSPGQSPGEELLSRYRLAKRIDYEAESERAYDELADRLPAEHPEEAVRTYTTLAESEDEEERRAVAIIIHHLFNADREVTLNIWSKLLADEAFEVYYAADDTLNEAMYDQVLTLDEAARLKDIAFETQERFRRDGPLE